MKYLRRVRKKLDDRGASAVEYGMMVAAVAALIVGTVFSLGHMVASAFEHTCSAMASDPAGLGDAKSCGGTTGNIVPGGTEGTTTNGTPPPDPAAT